MRKLRKLAVLLLIAAMTVNSVSYADVVLSDRPFGENTGLGTAVKTAGTGKTQTSNTQNTASTGPSGAASQAGTTGTWTKNTSGSDVSQGPGAGTSSSSPSSNGTTGNGAQGPAKTTQTTQKTGSSVQQVVIDSKITKPTLNSEAGVLYDVTTGQVLFEKNGNEQLYPASITKVMTALLAAENLSLSSTFTFTDSATKNLESGATNVEMTTGDVMTVEDALYALLLKSACEVANGLGEAVSGSQTKFAELMNKKAAELGCKNTSFRNASGLNDTAHLTTAYDMALIAAAAFQNAEVRKVCSSKSWTIPATNHRASMTLSNSNKMLYSNKDEYFEGVVGGKTGYTSKAGNTLVECVDIGGHELIAVVMKSQSKQYVDAKALLNYGKSLINAQQNTSTPAAKEGSWYQTSAGYKYKKADGQYAKSEWLDIGENEYFFDANGIMATGWKQFTNGAWYYFDTTTGAMVHDKWVTTDQVHYYYLKSNGVMATNTVINGVYRVDSTGAYVEKVG